MPDLEVDVDGLEAVVVALQGVADGLDDTRATVDAAESILGSSDVYHALDDFENHWDDGRGQIKENMESVQQTLTTAVTEYRKADDDLAAALEEQENTHHTVTAS